MDIIYTWTVIEMEVLLDVNSMQNVVNYVVFVVTAEKDGVKIESKEWNTFLPQPSSGTQFIAFDNLTNDMVISWCQQVLGQEFVDGIYSRLSERINLILESQDPIRKPLPW
jgi:hypothetical protein